MIIKTIVNFLSNEECEQFISLINKNNQKNTVVDDITYGLKIHESRTSSGCFFNNTEPFICDIVERMSKYLNIDSKRIESLQGQKYEVGQFFKPHFDYIFSNIEYHTIKQAGNREWTLLLYLNDNFEGGQTGFPKLNYEVKPRKGMALLFQNMENGEIGRAHV